MLTEEEIERKYQIIYINKQRYYREDLSKKDYSLEFSTPVSLEVGGKSFITSSWKQLLLDVCSSYLQQKPSLALKFFDYEESWSNKTPFYVEQKKNCYQIGEYIYLMCNHTATHACWLLQDILKMCDVDLHKCNFIIHRTPGSEPMECRVFYEDKIKKAFKYYYSNLLRYPEEKADQVLRNIDKLNRLLTNYSKAYDNFYLINDKQTFCSYKTNFLKYLSDTLRVEEKALALSNKYLSILNEFYKDCLW